MQPAREVQAAHNVHPSDGGQRRLPGRGRLPAASERSLAVSHEKAGRQSGQEGQICASSLQESSRLGCGEGRPLNPGPERRICTQAPSGGQTAGVPVSFGLQRVRLQQSRSVGVYLVRACACM